jgi:DNA-directed RNA polymerase subunit B'
MTDVFMDGRYLGKIENPDKLVNSLKEKRRTNKVSQQINVAHREDLNEIRIVTDPGRVRRPLIIVEDGKPLLTREHLEKIQKGSISRCVCFFVRSSGLRAT